MVGSEFGRLSFPSTPLPFVRLPALGEFGSPDVGGLGAEFGAALLPSGCLLAGLQFGPPSSSFFGLLALWVRGAAFVGLLRRLARARAGVNYAALFVSCVSLRSGLRESCAW